MLLLAATSRSTHSWVQHACSQTFDQAHLLCNMFACRKEAADERTPEQIRKDLERLELIRKKREDDRLRRIKEEGWDRWEGLWRSGSRQHDTSVVHDDNCVFSDKALWKNHQQSLPENSQSLSSTGLEDEKIENANVLTQSFVHSTFCCFSAGMLPCLTQTGPLVTSLLTTPLTARPEAFSKIAARGSTAHAHA